MKNAPVITEFYAVAFVGGVNVACRQCKDEAAALAQCQRWQREHSGWSVKVRRVNRVLEVRA